jgi:twitching motility protein PilT
MGMQLLDDNLFKLYKSGICDKKEVLLRSNNLDDMTARIAKAERGIFEDEATDKNV